MKFHKYRLFTVIGILFAIWSLLLVRAFYVQVLPDEKLKVLQERQFKRVVTLQPGRGVITDRNGTELASSITSYSLFADPSLIESPTNVSYKLSSLLKRSAKSIRRTISDKDKRFVWIDRKMDEKMKNRISNLKIRGLGFVEESKRIYPNHHLLSHVLGFVGQEGQGLEGLEMKYNDQLSGNQKKLLIQKDARGRPLIVSGKLFNDQPDGANLQLTIDGEIQHVLEQELRITQGENDADSAVGVVIEAGTNEIVAIASVPDFNLNNALSSSMDYRKNRAVVDPFEPGSTLKPFIVAGALREKKLEPNTKYYCEKGSFRVADRIIRDSDVTHKYEWLTVSEILAKSSNIGMAKIGLQLGSKKTREILEEFGFGSKTGVQLGGDAKGILAPLPWREVKLANIAFGQGVATSALQMANAYAAIANGGVLKEPLLVKAIVDPQTGEKEEFQSKVVRRVLTEEQSQTMLLMLMGVTNQEGTAMSARVSGFPVAGKTGTAQKADPNGGGYLKGAYISSFAGIIPANNPKYIIYVAVDNPRKKIYYGSEVAAPVFAKVAGYAIRKSGVSPILLTQDNLIKTKSLQKSSVAKIENEIRMAGLSVEEQFLGLTVREVLSKSKAQNIPTRLYGSGQSYKVQMDGSEENPTELRVYFK